MKVLNSIVLCTLIFAVNIAFAVSPSGEAVKTFSELSKPSGGVNLISGDASFSLPIASIKGKSGLSAELVLAYSSNVFMNVRAKNDIAPTSVVGLGWELLAASSVVADHKGTVKFQDDEYYFMGPAGGIGDCSALWNYCLKRTINNRKYSHFELYLNYEKD